ncbi:hypothetical protein Lal_00013728 [Lupinus albus]|nr:hypothetical protein Lal_00013728 [Lupinus albus]
MNLPDVVLDHLRGVDLPDVVLEHLRGVDLPDVVLDHLRGVDLADVVLDHLRGVDLPDVVWDHLRGVDLPDVVLDHLRGVDLPDVVLDHLCGVDLPYVVLDHLCGVDLPNMNGRRSYITWEDNDTSSASKLESEEQVHLSLMACHHSDDEEVDLRATRNLWYLDSGCSKQSKIVAQRKCSPGRKMAHLMSGKLVYTEGFSPGRELARLGEGERVGIRRMERVCELIHENPKTPKSKMWLKRKMGEMVDVEDEKDPKVGGGSEGTFNVTQNRAQHPPR